MICSLSLLLSATSKSLRMPAWRLPESITGTHSRAHVLHFCHVMHAVNVGTHPLCPNILALRRIVSLRCSVVFRRYTDDKLWWKHARCAQYAWVPNATRGRWRLNTKTGGTSRSSTWYESTASNNDPRVGRSGKSMLWIRVFAFSRQPSRSLFNTFSTLLRITFSHDRELNVLCFECI